MKNLCLRPFYEVSVDPNGRLQFCCHNEQAILNSRGERATLLDVSEYQSNESYNNLRRAMALGEKPDSCRKCWDLESNGITSLRQTFNAEFLINSPLKPSIKSLEIRLGNKCNLRCKMCNPHSSHLMESDWRALNLPFERVKSDWANEIQSFAHIETSNLESITFHGGEPLINIAHLEFLRQLHNKEKIHLKYITNFTHFPENQIPLWEQFKNIEFNVSIDGYKNSYEYIRHGASWKKLISNLENLSKLGPKFSTSVMTTISWLSIEHITDLLEWLEQSNIKRIFIHPVTEPKVLSLNTKYEELNNYLETMQGKIKNLVLKKDCTVAAQTEILNLLKMISNQPAKSDIKQLVDWLARIDVSQQSQLIAALPQLAKSLAFANNGLI